MKTLGHCEICGINMLMKVPNQRFCSIHTLALRSFTGAGRQKRIEELKKKYEGNPKEGWDE